MVEECYNILGHLGHMKCKIGHPLIDMMNLCRRCLNSASKNDCEEGVEVEEPGSSMATPEVDEEPARMKEWQAGTRVGPKRVN